MSKLKLYVMRHAETNVNAKNLVNARNMIGLNKNGREQAKKALEEIGKLEIDLIICSPLRRTVQTCNIVNSRNVKVIYDRRIMERNAGNMQFKPCDSINYNLWYDIDKDIIYKNTEGFKRVITRVAQFIEEIKEKYPNKTVLLVTHGDICKAIYSYINRVTDAKIIKACKNANCSIREYEL